MPDHVLQVVERDFPDLHPMIAKFYATAQEEKNAEKAATTSAAAGGEGEEGEEEAVAKPEGTAQVGEKRAREEEEAPDDANKQAKSD